MFARRALANSSATRSRADSDAAYSAGPLTLSSDEDEDEDMKSRSRMASGSMFSAGSFFSGDDEDEFDESDDHYDDGNGDGKNSSLRQRSTSTKSSKTLQPKFIDKRSSDSHSIPSSKSSSSSLSSHRTAKTDGNKSDSSSSSEPGDNDSDGKEQSNSDTDDNENHEKQQGSIDKLASEICKTLREQARNGDDVMRLIKVRFESLDRDRKGFINAEEFRQLIAAVLGGRAISSDNAADLLKRFKADTDKNGHVSYDEFVSFVSLDRHAIANMANKLRHALHNLLRKDETGSVADLFGRFCDARRNAIGTTEFQNIARVVKVGAEVLTAGELEGLMRYLDRQGKGFIDISDFQLFIEDSPSKTKSRSKSVGMDEEETKDTEEDAAAAHVVVDVRLAIHGQSKKRKEEQEALLAQGYTRLASNLNDRGRGYPLHLFVKRANSKVFADEDAFQRARVTDIALSRSSKDASMLALGYQCVEPYSVNEGAWFTRTQYLWIRRNAEDPHPILDIAVTAGRKRDLASKLWTPPFRGYKRIEGDLNAGNRGSQVFLWYFKDQLNQDEGPFAQMARICRSKLRALADKQEINLDKLWEQYDKRDKGYIPRAKVRYLITQDVGIKLEKTDLSKVLDLLDVNRDGRIDRDEFMEFLAFNPAEVDRLMVKIYEALVQRDLAGSRSAIKRWFLSSASESGSAATAEYKSLEDTARSHGRRASAASKIQTTSKSPKEMSRALKKIGIKLAPEELKTIMGRFDKSGDGLVDAKEFVDAILLCAKRVKVTKAQQEEEGDAAAKTYVNVELAARKLRSYARNLAGPDLDMSRACDGLLGGGDKDRLTRDRVREILQSELKLDLSDKEIAMLLLRTGTSRTKVTDFCTCSTYLDAVLNRVVDAALNVEIHRFFRQLDSAGQGRLSRVDFANGLKNLELDGQHIQLSPKEVNQIVQRFDQDGDGFVDLDEFLQFIQSAERARRAARDALLDEEERKLDDARVVYVFSALRKLHVASMHSVDQLFAKFCDNPDRQTFSLDGLERGLQRLGLVPQEVQLSAAQFQQVFRRLDLAGIGVVNKRQFERFLTRRQQGNKSGGADLMSPQVPLSRRLRSTLKPVVRSAEATFHEIDIRGTGRVLAKAFIQVLQGLEIPSRDAQTLAKAFPSENATDAVDYEAFFAWIDQRHQSPNGRKRSPRSSPTSGDDYASSFDRGEASESRAVRLLRRGFGSKARLLAALKSYSEGSDGRLSRNSVNEMLDDAGLGRLSYRDWHELGASSARELCAEVFSTRRGGRSPRRHRGRHSRRSPHSASYYSSSEDDKGDAGDLGNNEDDEEDDEEANLLAEASLARDYVARCLREAMRKENFSWEPAVRLFDHDGSGAIRLRDMSRVLRSIGCRLPLTKLRSVAHVLAAVRDGGQRVNYEHFFARILESASEAANGGSPLHRGRTLGESHEVVPSFAQVEAKIRNALRAEGFAEGLDLDDELARLDRNGNGRVSAVELARALPRLLGGVELSPGELQAIIDQYDHNENGQIELAEFSELIELKDADIDELVVRVKEELRKQARLGTQLIEHFEQYDVHGDGHLSRREFRKCLDQLLPPGRRLGNREVRRLMDRFDQGHHGRVNYQAFCEICNPTEIEMLALEAKVREKVRGIARQSQSDPVDLRRAFKLFDASGSGKISRREFKQACDRLGLSLSEDELELMLKRFDTNGNGTVDYFEFCRFIEYDGAEVEDLVVRAGRHLDNLQREQRDVVQAFAILEGRRRPVGILPRHGFYRGCRDLHMPFSDAEISALADLYSDSGSVKYRDFVLSSLARAGARYLGALASSVNGASGFPFAVDAPSAVAPNSTNADHVWNPSIVQAWLSSQATLDQKRKFEHLHQAMARTYMPPGAHPNSASLGPLHSMSRVSSDLSDEENLGQASQRHSQNRRQQNHRHGEAPRHLKGTIHNTPAFAVPKDRWDCPVCFYKQARGGRLTCEMCDSPCPTPQTTQGGHWPHVKPIFDEAYKHLGSVPAGVSLAVVPAIDLGQATTSKASTSRQPKKAPIWHLASSIDSPRSFGDEDGESARESGGRHRRSPRSSPRSRGSDSRSRSPRTAASNSPRSSRYY